MDEAVGNLRRRVASYPLGEAPGHLIRRCQQRAVDLFFEEVGDGGPTPRQFAVLLTVYQKPGMMQADLVRITGIDRSTLAEVIRRLTDRGQIARVRTAADRRANALKLTPAGEAALLAAFEAAERAQRRILEPVARNRRGEAMAVLALLAGLPPHA